MGFGVLAALVIGAAFYMTDPYGNPPFRGPVSDHFDGERFTNPGGRRERGFRDFLRWRMESERGVWPEFQETPPAPAPPRAVQGGNLRVTFINHSTVLIQAAGFNILTDPVWSKRVGPVFWLGPRRHHSPGIRIEDLPRIHVVMLSHNHYDHLDVPTLRTLSRAHAPVFVAPLGVGALLAACGLGPSVELDWWGKASLPSGLNVTCVPARHFSVRGFRDRNRALWCGYVLECEAGNIYFAGDTGYGPHFEQIGKQFGPLRLALLPIGAYQPEWFMLPVHISPREALCAHREVRAQTSVAIHHSTFALADEGQKQPQLDLLRALEEGGEPRERFWVLGFGEGRDVPAISAAETAGGAVTHASLSDLRSEI
ncbi:MAG: MBL fold metallo-hydrolase [Terriglobia bacterium]